MRTKATEISWEVHFQADHSLGISRVRGILRDTIHVALDGQEVFGGPAGGWPWHRGSCALKVDERELELKWLCSRLTGGLKSVVLMEGANILRHHGTQEAARSAKPPLLLRYGAWLSLRRTLERSATAEGQPRREEPSRLPRTLARLPFQDIPVKDSWFPWILVGATVLLLVVVAVFVDLSPHVDSGFFFSSDDPAFQSEKKLSELFPSGPQIIIGVEAPVIYSRAYMARIAALTDALRRVPGVSTVKSLSHGPADIDDALKSPMWKRLLISDDRRSTNLIVLLAGEDYRRIVKGIEHACKRFDGPDFRVKTAGVPYLVEQMRRCLLRDLAVFSVATFLVFGVMVWVFFRSKWIVFGTLTTCVTACLLALAGMHVAGMQVGLLTANLSTVVFVMTLSHIVFLTNNWRALLREAASPEAAVRGATAVTFSASFWCMVTTFLGFASLLLAKAKPLREFGLSGTIGVIAAIAAAYAVYPPFLRRSTSVLESKEKAPKGLVNTSFSARSRLVPVAIGLLAFLAIPGIFLLDTDPSLLSYFASGSELREGLEYIDHSGGSSPLRLAVRDKWRRPLNSAEAYERMWGLQKRLENLRGVGTVISLPVVMAEGDRHPLAFLKTWEGLLKTMEKPEYGRIARGFVTADRRYARFLLRMKESDLARSRLNVVEDIRKMADRHGFVAEYVGGVYTLQGHLSAMVASSVVWGVLGLLVLLGLIGRIISGSRRIMIAVVASLAVIPISILGLISYLGHPLDIISSPASNVAMAIGVDSMIHLVIGMKRAKEGGATEREAWARASTHVSKAVITATLIVCAGFAIFILSTFPPTRRLGLAVVIGALVAAPASLALFPYLARRVTG